MKNTKTLMTVAAMATLGFAANAAHALTFDLSLVYTGATPGGTAPWMTITITDVAADTVNMSISHNASSAAGQFISDVYFNLDPFVGSMSVSNEVNANKRSGLTLSNNGINGAAGNVFDMNVQFVTSNSSGGANRLKPGETWSADLMAAGLSANSFNAVNNMGNYVGAHLQGIQGGLSSHITTPEPGTWAAIGLGALALLRKRKKA
ncbi:MAG TPA: PEP-CTERM sorting domain-containing protein [Fimbriimonadaceae bacterium]|nr:PEP-CTERM sorting domain-containing protein [Fimbriimonadaceae bacterium]